MSFVIFGGKRRQIVATCPLSVSNYRKLGQKIQEKNCVATRGAEISP
jgi:hypothetical protein